MLLFFWKKINEYSLILALLLLLIFSTSAIAYDYESLRLINSTNWANKFDKYFGYLYDSHGCLHLTPSDIYLFSKVVYKGMEIDIKGYNVSEGSLPRKYKDAPFLQDITNSLEDIKSHIKNTYTWEAKVEVFPAANKLFITINGKPYAKIRALSGLPNEYLTAFEVNKNNPIIWDSVVSTPTDPGQYKILKSTDHYISSTYYINTVVPFGAWIVNSNGRWVYQKNGIWYRLPEAIRVDVVGNPSDRQYNYYDFSYNKDGSLHALRWAGGDFGKYAVTWTKDGVKRYPELAYCAGQLLYEQIILIKDIVKLLTLPNVYDFDSCVSRDENLSFYRKIYEFIQSKGKNIPKEGEYSAFSYYKLFNNFELDAKDNSLIDPRVLKAFNEYNSNTLPRNKDARRKALGLYEFLRQNSLNMDEYANIYKSLRDDWGFYVDLKKKLEVDFQSMGIYSQDNRQNVLEGWLSGRLEFQTAMPPSFAKNAGDLSFRSFFEENTGNNKYTERERDIMYNYVLRSLSGEAGLIDLYSVDALNSYNFGILLSEILGDLYWSHGCLHVSPRNMIFLYRLVPINSRITIYDYSKDISRESLSKVANLADLVNFSDDLDKLKTSFLTREVEIAVYPKNGQWIIYLDKQAFAKLDVKSGPKTVMRLLKERDKNGKPIFEGSLAYPTRSGRFFAFKKVEDYLSNLYRDTTIVPMDSKVMRIKDKWVYEDRKGNIKNLPQSLASELDSASDSKYLQYYGLEKDSSGEVVALKWGGNPFGRYIIQMSYDKIYPVPEIIHSSGDLILEERGLVDDLISVLSAPYDNVENCVENDENFSLYKACYDFTANSSSDGIVGSIEAANYRLYYSLPLSQSDIALLPKDAIVAFKYLRGKEALTGDEEKLLVVEGIAKYSQGKLSVDKEKAYGLCYDVYRYVVAIEKLGGHYETLKKHWPELYALRKALLYDFNNLTIKDPKFFHDFTKELMLERVSLHRIDKNKALLLLKRMIEEMAANSY